jgi:ubiquinone/menaquinone biosynthesis C-methylase UbiE
MPVPEQLYDALAAGYDAAWPAPAPELLEILREAGIGGGRILDVGVGTGIASQALAQGGATIAGIDPSAGMLAQAPSRLAQAELVRGRAEALPFADRSFDAAICADVTWLGALEARLLAAYGSLEAAVPVRVVSFVYLGRA